MKKSRLKALKQLAEILPKAYIRRKHTERGFLWELHRLQDEGYIFKNGLETLTEENRNVIHSVTYDAIDQINHYKRLKKVWRESGTKGVKDYIVWLKGHNERWAKREQELNVEQVDPGLYEIAKLNVKSFWKSLIAFLFSFAVIFQKKINDTSEKMIEDMDEKIIEKLNK